MSHKLKAWCWLQFLLAMIFVASAICEAGGAKSTSFLAGHVRALVDTVGFCFNKTQIEQVVAVAESLEAKKIRENNKKLSITSSTKWIAGICPHDDHLLAGRVYVHLFQNLKAKRYVVFGVAHRAAKWQVEDKIIFDTYDCWRGPYGRVKVGDIRTQLVDTLPTDDYLISDEFQCEEHSVEGIVPFIQHYTRDAEIVSILVPYMDWPRIQKITADLGVAFADIILRNDWKLGEDIAFICSNDGDHYGDEDWGGKNFAPFGADECGHRIASVQDSLLAETTLCGELAAEKLHAFCERVWGEGDLHSYKIRWCGRFAIPFGLECVRRLTKQLGQAVPQGFLLRHDTSYRLDKLPLQHIGIGTTAPNNIHHWVGYTAIGYR